MVILYFFVFIFLSAAIPGRNVVTANPSLAEWAWVLGGAAVHVLFLAVFCQRWLVVEQLVPAGPAPRPSRASARRR